MADNENKWDKPGAPPPRLFTGQKEKDLVKSINDELIERVIGQRILYHPIDVERTNFDTLYGEAIEKTFHNPIIVHARVFWKGLETSFEDSFGPDKRSKIDVHFQKRRLDEDLELFVQEGDVILWGDIYYEIHTTSLPEELWGDGEDKFAIVAHCLKAREGFFNGK